MGSDQVWAVVRKTRTALIGVLDNRVLLHATMYISECVSRVDPGGRLGQSPLPRKPTKVTLFAMIVYNS